MRPTPPTRFLRTTAALTESLRCEHQALGRAVGAVRALLAGDFDWEEAYEHLVDLATHLDAHFECEERGGYLDAVLELAPHRGDEVRRLRTEHQSLHDRFVGLLAATITLRDRDEFRDEVAGALGALAAHEQRENGLVMDTLLVSAGGE